MKTAIDNENKMEPLELTKRILSESDYVFPLLRVRQIELDPDQLFIEYSADDEENSSSYGSYLCIDNEFGTWSVFHNEAHNAGGHPTNEQFSDSDLEVMVKKTVAYVASLYSYQNGFSAFYDIGPKARNPYKQSDARFISWQEGFNLAADE